MKSIVLGDVHEHFEWTEEVIKLHNPDEIYFVGDYFDFWELGASYSERTALWLKSHLDDPRYHFGLGNHDCSQFFPTNKNLTCSGYTRNKKDAIHKVLNPFFGKPNFHADMPAHIVRKFRLAYYVDGFLLSHAGINPVYIPLKYSHLTGKDLADKLLEMCDYALEQVISKQYNPLVCDVSYKRGGDSPGGGILWQDWSEFEPISFLNQICGHSSGTELRCKTSEDSVNYCIDTSRTPGKRGYAIIEDGKFSYLETEI